eukprot:999514-Rhodomonas_salina.2
MPETTDMYSPRPPGPPANRRKSRQCRVVQVPRLLEQNPDVCAAASSRAEPERGRAGRGVADEGLGQTPSLQCAARLYAALSPPPMPPA